LTDTRPPTPRVGDPEQAWKALALVTDWVRHAESKAAATLAAAGVVGGVLYSLVKDQHHASSALLAAAVICGFFVLAAALFAGFSLVPRVWSAKDPANALYFHHIAQLHVRSAGSTSYSVVFRSLIANNERLINEIADQIWANAHIARAKFRWGNLGLTSLLLAVITLAATVLIVSIQT
jgi:hypothetical protein